MKLSRTSFDFEKHGTRINSGAYGDKLCHEITVWNSIVVDGVEYYACYQTCSSYEHADYNYPSASLELSECGGDETFLTRLNALYEEDIETLSDEDLQSLQELAERDFTRAELLEIDLYLQDNCPDVEDFYDDYEMDLENYEVDEDPYAESQAKLKAEFL